MTRRSFPAFAVIALAVALNPCEALSQGASNGDAETAARPAPMSTATRTASRQIAIVPGPSPHDQGVEGTYDKDTLGFIGGVDAGTRAATVETDVGGANVRFPIPVLMWPARLLGGIAGKTQREIQEFRDALTEDLRNDRSPPLTNENLALNVYQGMRRLPAFDARLFAADAPLPDAMDARLHVTILTLGIDVQGSDAIVTTIAEGTVFRQSDEKQLYKTIVYYADRDTLARWTANDNALWHSYADFARHYVGREIAAQVFELEPFEHELQPATTASVKPLRKNVWHGTSKTLSPTLAWQLTLPEGNVLGADGTNVVAPDLAYDLEIYDQQRLVYAEKLLAEPQHTVAFGLEPCKAYRWTVRPAWRTGDNIHYGNWMQAPAPTGDSEPSFVGAVGVDGRRASESQAMLQDYAVLDVKCGSK